MKVKIVFDKESAQSHLYSGWGLSFFVGESTLFDTGTNGKWLLKNFEHLKIDALKIKDVVISHEHWDHVNGLWKLIEKNNKINVHVCAGFSSEFKQKIADLKVNIVERKDFGEITRNIYSSGEVDARYNKEQVPEQALVIRTKSGFSLLTGCAHSGILKIIDLVKKNLKITELFLVFGGFHLGDMHKLAVEELGRELKKMNVRKIGPTHCTGEVAMMVLRDIFKNDFVEIKTGQTVEV